LLGNCGTGLNSNFQRKSPGVLQPLGFALVYTVRSNSERLAEHVTFALIVVAVIIVVMIMVLVAILFALATMG